MAIGLQNYPRIQSPDSDFPDGRLKDNDGSTPGTPINELTNGDIHQFFAKLMRLAGIAPNELPESEYVGFQYVDALEDFVNNFMDYETISGTGNFPLVGSVNLSSASIRNAKCIRNGKQIFLSLSVIGNTVANTGFNWTVSLPSGFRMANGVFLQGGIVVRNSTDNLVINHSVDDEDYLACTVSGNQLTIGYGADGAQGTSKGIKFTIDIRGQWNGN